MLSAIRANPTRAVALAAVGAVILVSAPRDLYHTWGRLREAWTFRGETADDAHRRLFGPSYWNRVEALRAQIPRDGSYFMVRPGDESGADSWVRFDLAPRRPRLVAQGTGARLERFVPARPAGGPKDVVAVPTAGKGPVLLDEDVFWGEAPGGRPGLEDVTIPSNVDEPAKGARVKGGLVVVGWCQEWGGRPCSDVRLFVDAEPMTPGALDWFPRPDVEEAVAGIGNCDRAGFRAVFAPGAVGTGPHVLRAIVRTSDGRYRRLGPTTFEVVP